MATGAILHLLAECGARRVASAALVRESDTLRGVVESALVGADAATVVPVPHVRLDAVQCLEHFCQREPSDHDDDDDDERAAAWFAHVCALGPGLLGDVWVAASVLGCERILSLLAAKTERLACTDATAAARLLGGAPADGGDGGCVTPRAPSRAHTTRRGTGVGNVVLIHRDFAR